MPRGDLPVRPGTMPLQPVPQPLESELPFLPGDWDALCGRGSAPGRWPFATHGSLGYQGTLKGMALPADV